MKKVFVILSLAFIICSCGDEGYTTINMVSRSTFEFSMSDLTDSLYTATYFWGGSSSYEYLIYNNYRAYSASDMTGGFGITAKRDSSLVIKDNNKYPQYTMYATSAASNSSMCAFFLQNTDSSAMPEHDIIFADINYGTCTPVSCAINNTQQTVYDVLASDDKFVQGDYLKLTITGYLGSTKTGSVDYYLADHRTNEDEPDSVLTRWRTISLTALGNIQYVDFELSSNRENFPSTFCLDDFVASIYVAY